MLPALGKESTAPYPDNPLRKAQLTQPWEGAGTREYPSPSAR